MVEIPFQSALDLGRQILYKKISSVDLTQVYLDRLQARGPELGALVTLTADLALEQAKQFDHELARGHVRSPLHGVPYGIKDLFSTKGIPTTWGSPIYRHRIIDHDAAVVVKLREAGCPLLGKLAMVEFAGSLGYRYANASVTGAGRTPWNIEHWSGGSSSGSGAAVAAGLVGFAIGTETWGSILCPSAFCGVAGLRPTSGRVSRDGAMALSWTMDKIGPLARTVADTAAVLELISGPEGDDPAVRPTRQSKFKVPLRLPSVKGMKIGIIRPDYGKGKYVQPETDRAFETALRELQSLGMVLVETKLPDLPTDEAATKIFSCEGASAFEEVTRDEKLWQQLVDPETKSGLIAGLVVPAVDYIRSLRIRDMAQRTIPEVFSQLDALVSPSFTQVAPPVSVNMDDYFAAGNDGKISGYGNMLGLPAIGVSMGFGYDNLPLGIQFVGPPLAEANLVSIASAYEKATKWHTLTPPLFTSAR